MYWWSGKWSRATTVTVVSLLLPQSEARAVAAAGGEVVLVLEAPGG
jgi:hypothetical protein